MMAPVHMLHLHLHMLPDCLSAFVPLQKAIELANAYANAFLNLTLCVACFFFLFLKQLILGLGRCVEMTNS